jgi:hypothetical protein
MDNWPKGKKTYRSHTDVVLSLDAGEKNILTAKNSNETVMLEVKSKRKYF